MSRAFPLTLLTLCLSASIAAAADDAPVRTTPFADVPKTHWAYGAIETLREKGILRGYSPEAPDTRLRQTKPNKVKR